MSQRFDDFYKSLQPPPDGTYPFIIAEWYRTKFEVRTTLEVTDGEYVGKRARVSLNIEREFAVIKKLMDAIDAASAKQESDLLGRRLYATIRHGDQPGKLFMSKPEPIADDDIPSGTDQV